MAPPRELAIAALEAAGVETDDVSVNAALAVGTFIAMAVVMRMLRKVTHRGQLNASSNSGRLQLSRRDQEAAKAEQQAAERALSIERARLQGLKGTNSFGRILADKERRQKESAQAALNAPRHAWLGKSEFISTQRKANLLLGPRMRCWFADCCYRTGKDHHARYTHPGEKDWTPQHVPVLVKEATAQVVKDTARAFTKAGGRGDFIEYGKAAHFLKDYSGLPSVFLHKIATNLGGFGVTSKIRREQFAYAMQAVDSVQAEITARSAGAKGPLGSENRSHLNGLSIADLVFDGLEMMPGSMPSNLVGSPKRGAFGGVT
jgi:hypothetical protein